MDIITSKVNTPIQIHLESATLTTGLTATQITALCYSTTAVVTSSSISYSVTEIGSTTHYVASATFTTTGIYYLKISYSTFSAEYMVNVQEEDLSFLSGKLKGGENEYVYTVTDSSSNAVEGATVRTFDSAGTKLLMKLTTNSLGKVTMSLPTGTYKVYTTKTGYDFSSVNPTTITVTASNYNAPIVDYFLPVSPSASSSLAIKGLNFNSTTVVLVGGSAVTPSSRSTNGDLLLVTMPGSISGTVTVQVRSTDPADSSKYFLSKSYTLSVT